MSIPTSYAINNTSAILSKTTLWLIFIVLIEKKENKLEKESNKVTKLANSSISVDSDLLETCKEVITNKQEPSKFSLALKIGEDVLLDMENQVCSFLLNTCFNSIFHNGQRPAWKIDCRNKRQKWKVK